MIDSASQRETTLPEFLATRARHASDRRLVANVLGGLVAAVAVAYWRGPAWSLLLGIAVAFLAYGLWGITDRELAERPGAPRRVMLPLTAIRAFAAILGFGAAAFLAIAVLGKALGRMIS